MNNMMFFTYKGQKRICKWKSQDKFLFVGNYYILSFDQRFRGNICKILHSLTSSNSHLQMIKRRIQWAPPNGIMVNGNIRLKGSNKIRFSGPKFFFFFLPNVSNVSISFAYCYHLVIGISFGLDQSDPVNRHLL